ncbi:CPBP family intramembrane glutamic endopeptidase [Actinoplanes rectilineatus]|uniref:CPBP family intramembrane glutamic endopeptidase n=1 Tax=Actinoplanes rectilineatus TaxID=113571 RepID=UPI0005F2BB92|nr:CPBP family intramembrane glutamic endopeptidase [Actinoplanes rectilineatus]
MTTAPLLAPPVHRRTEYHRVLAGDRRRVGRGLLAIVLLAAGVVGATIGLGAAAARLEAALGLSGYTPVGHAATMLAIGLTVPWAMLLQRWLYGVPGPSLSSVVGTFRTAVFGRALLVILPMWTVSLVVVNLSMPYATTPWPSHTLAAFFVVTVLTTPLQAAGEEYGLRGLVFRVAASWGRGPVAALTFGVAGSSLLFAALHASSDPWLNLYYVVFGVTLALITWRIGGLEIAVVIHAVNNTVAFIITLLLQMDLTVMFDRSAGSGSVIMLLPCALHVTVAAAVWWRTRHAGPARTPAEG